MFCGGAPPSCEWTSHLSEIREKNTVFFLLMCQNTHLKIRGNQRRLRRPLHRQPLSQANLWNLLSLFHHHKTKTRWNQFACLDENGNKRFILSFFLVVVDPWSHVLNFTLQSNDQEVHRKAQGLNDTTVWRGERDVDSPRTLLLEMVTKKTSSHVGQNSILVRLYWINKCNSIPRGCCSRIHVLFAIFASYIPRFSFFFFFFFSLTCTKQSLENHKTSGETKRCQE